LSQGRGKARLSLVFVTLDSSGSRIHDVQSHHFGRTIEAIRRTLREGDIVFRYSRRELVLLLSNTDSAGAAAFVGTIAANIADGTPDSGAEETRTGATFGVATAPLDGTNSEDLVRAARSRAITDSGSSPVGSIH
jgi:GGDEF domain-containing protein